MRGGGVGLALAVVACSSGRTDRGEAAPSATETASATASVSPSVSASASSVALPAPRGELLPDVTPEERRKVCGRMTARSRGPCRPDPKLEAALEGECAVHPIWECVHMGVKNLERCWVPLDRFARPEECGGFSALLDKCDVAGVIRTRCPGFIESVGAGTPAAAAGLRAGDRIVSVDGKPWSYLDNLAAKISSSEGKPVTLVVKRADGKATEEIHVTPKKDGAFYRIGVIPSNPPECKFIPTRDLLSCAEPLK